jgi:hypothetical protein
MIRTILQYLVPMIILWFLSYLYTEEFDNSTNFKLVMKNFGKAICGIVVIGIIVVSLMWLYL